MKTIFYAFTLLLLATGAHAADIEAGKAKVHTVCAACHGASGVSVGDTIPNLAGQRAVYLENQLKLLKDGSRKNAIMNAIASPVRPISPMSRHSSRVRQRQPARQSPSSCRIW